MLYINQRDYPDMLYPTLLDTPEHPKSGKTTVFSSACGPCSAMMALDRLVPACDYSFTLEDALQLSYETGANHASGTDGKLYFPAFAEKFGLRYVPTNDIEEVKMCLRTGGAVIALVGEREEDGYVGVFTHKEHYICMIAVLSDGRFELLDPYFYDGKYDEPGREGKVELDGHIARCTESVILDDTLLIRRRTEDFPPTEKTKAFHLFWRV